MAMLCFSAISPIRKFLKKANFADSKLIISTSPDLEDNLFILSELNKFKNNNSEAKAKIVLRAEDEKEAKILYDNSADYVLLPHFTSGRYLGKYLKKAIMMGKYWRLCAIEICL